MRILFICSSQEEGKDGVGDYVRRLAGELVREHQEVTIIGLFDKFTDVQRNYVADVDGVSVPTHRLPAKNGVDNNLDIAKQIAGEFKPDWISLHFVPYSYHQKGLPLGLGKKLKKVCTTYKWQIMIHELWIGREEGSGLMRLIISKVQKALVRSMLRTLSPQVIHTHLPVFYSKLKALGFEAKPLPLFSNIEKVEAAVTRQPGFFRVGFFSQAAATPAIVGFVKELSIDLLNKGLGLQLIFIGGNKDKMKLIGQNFEHIENIKGVEYTGFLDDRGVSLAMQSCDMGITPFPRHALGKSSSLSVFFAHGLPVAAPNIHFLYSPDEIGFFSEELKKTIVTEPNTESVARARAFAGRNRTDLEIGFITKQFLSDLTTA